MSAPLKLRRWQAEALPLALAALEAGRPGLVQATTGAGKSIFLAELLRRWREVHPATEGAVVVTTPSRKLVEQLSATFEGILGAGVVGRYYTAAKQDRREVVVCCNASVAALAARLEVAGRPVAVWIADECHRTESEGVKGADAGPGAAEMAGLLKARRRMGLTATPFRSDEEEALTLYDEVIYTYPPAEAMRDGVIVPTRYILPDVDDVEVDAWTTDAILALGDRAARGPGAVDASSIADAEEYVAFLAGRGLDARAIHSKQTPDMQRRTLAALQAGDLDCVVHVAMLVEGVDLPWLRWLAVRRETGSRIRWIQQVGRVIRAAPGKSEAVVIDPHAQSMDYSPTYAAALGWTDEQEEEKQREELRERERRDVEDAETPEERYVAKVSAVCRYLRALRSAVAAEGVQLQERREGRRGDSPTDRQIAFLRRLSSMSYALDDPHGQMVARIVAAPWAMTLGSAGDAIDILTGVSAWTRRHPKVLWKPAAPIPLPPERATEREDARPVVAYVGAAMRGPRVAGVVVRDGSVVLGKVREKVKGDTPGTVTGRLVDWATANCGSVIVRCSDATVARLHPSRPEYADAKDNPAVSRAWAMIVRAERTPDPGPPSSQPPTLAGSWAYRAGGS